MAFLAVINVFEFFISVGGLFQILAIFLEKLSFSEVDLASGFQHLLVDGLTCLPDVFGALLLGSSLIG